MHRRAIARASPTLAVGSADLLGTHQACHALSADPEPLVLQFPVDPWRAVGELERSWIALDADRGGYPERFGYAKLLFSAGACLILHRWTKQPTYLGWSFALLVAFTDDAFMLHERIGGELADRLALAPSFGLRAQDLGELLAWAILGMPVLTALVWTHRRSAGEAQRDSRILASMVFALAFFGVVMDMVHVTVTSFAERIAGTIEGAGELAVPSFIVAYVVASMLRVRNSANARDSVRLCKG